MLDNESKQTEEHAQEKNSKLALATHLVETVKNEEQLVNHLRQQSSDLYDRLMVKFGRQKKLVNIVKQLLDEASLASTDLMELGESIDSMVDTLDYIINDSNYLRHADRHLGNFAEPIHGLIDMCKLNIDALNREIGLDLKLDLKVAEGIDTERYGIHDYKFVSELFRYMALFFADIKDPRFRSPKIEYAISKGTAPQCYFSNMTFYIYKPDVIPSDLQESFNHYYEHEKAIPKSWHNLNKNLTDILQICSTYSIRVQIQQDAFGTTSIGIGRDIYTSSNLDDFRKFQYLREKYAPSRVIYIGQNRSHEERHCTLKLIEASEESFTYVPIKDFHPTLLSQARSLFLSSEIPIDGIKAIVNGVFMYPFEKVQIIATNRIEENPFEGNDRVLWNHNEVDFYELNRLLSR